MNIRRTGLQVRKHKPQAGRRARRPPRWSKSLRAPGSARCGVLPHASDESAGSAAHTSTFNYKRAQAIGCYRRANNCGRPNAFLTCTAQRRRGGVQGRSGGAPAAAPPSPRSCSGPVSAPPAERSFHVAHLAVGAMARNTVKTCRAMRSAGAPPTPPAAAASSTARLRPAQSDGKIIPSDSLQSPLKITC